MTKKHMEHAAAMVRAIRNGEWTNEAPRWAPVGAHCAIDILDDDSLAILRAVQTAEAFILLFREFSSRFDESRFLIACGLVEAPAKARRR